MIDGATQTGIAIDSFYCRGVKSVGISQFRFRDFPAFAGFVDVALFLPPRMSEPPKASGTFFIKCSAAQVASGCPLDFHMN